MAVHSTSELAEQFELKAFSAGLTIECPGDGMFNSTIAIIAEAPGPREVAARIPLVGGSGGLLWSYLKKYGITRNDVYITNVIKRHLVDDRSTEKVFINKGELDHWRGLLQWELSQLPNLKYVLLLGNHALQAVTPNSGIIKWRGSVLPIQLQTYQDGERSKRDLTAVCAFNPAFVIRDPKHELVFKHDIARLDKVINGRFTPHEVRTLINPSCAEAIQYIDKMAREDKPVAFDIETGAGETACVGLSNDPHEAMCINFRGVGQEHHYSPIQERLIRVKLQWLFSKPGVRLIAQNGMFDKTWLWFKDKIRTQPHYFDTMLAHHTLYPQLPHNLGFIVTQYTTHPYYKDEKDQWREDGLSIDNYWRYNAKDCALTLASALKMMEELRTQKLDKFFFEHVMRLQDHLARMTVGGVLIDTSLKETVRAASVSHVDELYGQFLSAVREATGDDNYTPNPKSPKQLSDLLFSRLRLVGRGTSTDDENRLRMFKHPRTTQAAREVLRTLGEYAKENKFFSTYANISIDEDNRCRSEYKQTGVASAPGRLSSAQTLWGHYDPTERKMIQHGANLQNQPERSHQQFIADPGYGFGYFDLSQAEARFVAWDARIEKWMADFERARLDGSYDCHRALAADMFKVPYDEVPTFDRDDQGQVTLRFIAKRCRHGLNYRMMADRLATTTGLPLSEAEVAFQKYHRATPELRRWWSDIEKEITQTRMLFNAYGRRFMLLQRPDDDALRSVVAFKPQSTIGDKVCRVIYQSEDDPRWPYNARIALNVHDALVCLAPIEKLKTCLSIMKKYAEEPLLIHGNQLIIPADLKVADSPTEINRWSTLKKVYVDAAR